MSDKIFLKDGQSIIILKPGNPVIISTVPVADNKAMSYLADEQPIYKQVNPILFKQYVARVSLWALEL